MKESPVRAIGLKSANEDPSQAIGDLRWNSGYSGSSSEMRSKSFPHTSFWVSSLVALSPSSRRDWTWV